MSLGVQRRAWIAALAGAAATGIYSTAWAGWLDRLKRGDEFLPLPQLDHKVPLRVVYAHNPRFARPAPELLAAVLQRTQALCLQHIRLNVLFEMPVEQDISTLFEGVTASVWRGLKADIYDYRDGPPDRKKLIAHMKAVVAGNRSAVGEQIAFAKPHLLSTTEPRNASTLAEALVDTQLARFAAWQQLQGLDGRALLNDSIFNEYFAWVFAPRTKAWPFEIVITNQMIVSVEYADNSVHSALRGGVSNGLTTQSPGSRYGSVSTLSLFPFTSQDPLTQQLRNDTQGTPINPTEAAAAMLTHELGHQLLHLGHPFNSKACVMNPPELLQFEAWMRGLDAAQCPLGNHAENKPGVLRFSNVKQPGL
jgi:hypothetical protein